MKLIYKPKDIPPLWKTLLFFLFPDEQRCDKKQEDEEFSKINWENLKKDAGKNKSHWVI